MVPHKLNAILHEAIRAVLHECHLTIDLHLAGADDCTAIGVGPKLPLQRREEKKEGT